MRRTVVTTTSATPSASDDLGDLASEKSYEKNDRTDLESLQPTAELCAWYRTRIAGFEAERAELLRRLTLCNPQREELHKTDWELRKRTDEVKDLQKVRETERRRLLPAESCCSFVEP
jgi:coiled-coil domain-containing protein 77